MLFNCLRIGSFRREFPNSRSNPGAGECGILGEMEAEIGGNECESGKARAFTVLAYGLFDGFTYITLFVLAFFGYEKSTGKNPAANLQALIGIMELSSHCLNSDMSSRQFKLWIACLMQFHLLLSYKQPHQMITSLLPQL